MRYYSIDFNRESGAEMDRFDLAAAHAGVSNGRNARYLNKLDTGHSVSGKGKSKDSDLVDFILTQNVDYEALFADTMNKVRDAEDVIDRALEIAEARYAESKAKLEEMTSRLPTLEDGTKIARSDKDGQIYTLDGKLVDPDVAGTIQFKGHKDSLETIQKQQDRTNTDFETLNGVRKDQLRLGEIREEMTDDDKPSANRVRELGEETSEIKERNTKIIEAQNNQNFENENQITNIDFSNSIDLNLSR